MYPYFHLFGFDIPSYGVVGTAGFLLGALVAVLRCKKYGLKREDMIFASLYAGIGVGIGGALLYALINIPHLIEHANLIKENFFAWVNMAFGGLVFYGGLGGGILGGFLYCKQFKLDFFTMLETFVPSIPLIHCIGRVACFLGGCCYGIPWPGWPGVVYTESLGAPNGVSLFPVQLLESGLNLILFIVIMLFARKKRSPGRLLGLYLVCYGGIRLITESFRYDAARKFFLGVSTSQWISLLIIPLGLAVWILVPKLKKKKTEE